MITASDIEPRLGEGEGLGPDLHQLLPQAGQRPLRDCLGQGQCPHEVGEIVGQRMQLETHRIGGDIENPRGGVRGVIPSKRVY